MTDQQDIVVVGCPATIAGGGDIWHIASAFALCSEGHIFSKNVTELVCLIGADLRGETRFIDLDRVRAFYNYLRSVGMRCLLVKFNIGDRDNETHAAYEGRLLLAISTLTQADYNSIFAVQHSPAELPILEWQNFWSHTECIDTAACVRRESLVQSQGPIVRAMLPWQIMATFVANYIHMDLSQREKQVRLEFVSRRILGDMEVEADALTALVNRKIAELQDLIAASPTAFGAKRRGPYVVLIMYRKSTVNHRQDANETILAQIRAVATHNGFMTIRVPTGITKTHLEDSDLDLFDVRSCEVSVDRRYVALFWRRVAQMEAIYGIVGARSGSLDIAALAGLNTFAWDEPLLEVIAGPEYPQLRRFYPPDYVQHHCWQLILYSIQLCSLHSVGILDPDSFDKITERYRALREGPLSEWLAGRKPYPTVPITQESVRHELDIHLWELLLTHCQIDIIKEACRTRIESEVRGIHSYNIRKLLESLRRQVALQRGRLGPKL